MGNRVKLQAYRTAGRPVEVAIDPDATEGASLGSNLLLASAVTLPNGTTLPAGYVIQPSDLLNAFNTSSGGSIVVGADWSQLTNIPANIVSAASLATAGLVTRLASGTWVTRSLSAGAGISIADGAGAIGNPAIAHADTSSVANLTSDNANGVVIQDIALTFDTFGHTQTATVGTVDLDLRYQPLDSTLTSLAALTDPNVDAIVFWDDSAGNYANLLIGNGLKIVGTTLSAGESGTEDGTTVLAGDGIWRDFVTQSFGSGGAYLPTNGLFDATNGGFWAQRSGGAARYVAAGAGTAAQPQFIGARSRGTLGSPTTVQSGDSLVEIYGSAYDGAGWGFPTALTMVASETHSGTAHGSEIAMFTTSNTTTSLVERLRLAHNGNMQFGTAASYGSGVRVISIQNAATAPTTNPTGGGIMFAEGGALKWRGPSGAVTTMGVA